MTPKNNTSIIVRFPPSPTGKLQIGNARTALFNFLFARKNGGQFILRLEDTDKERSDKIYEQDILDGLQWLGLSWDNDVIVRQSERGATYRAYVEKLIADGKAYVSEEQEGPNKEVIRFKNPNRDITFTDLIRGDITVQTEDLGDFIIARNLDEPLYHLAVVVDDFEAGVTHVIRGEDGIANTPRQILIGEALGAPRPQYAHVPLVLAEDKTKLSKRKHGDRVSIEHYKAQGFLPEAMINYLALLGWNPGGEQEIFTRDEIIAQFDITDINKSGAVFDETKLRYINKEHLKKKSAEENKEVIQRIFASQDIRLEDDMLDRAYDTILERVDVWSDLTKGITEGEYAYISSLKPYDSTELCWKENTPEITKEHLSHILSVLSEVSDFSNKDTLKEHLWNYAEEKGKGDVLWPLRFALSGQNKSPDPFSLLYILGKTESLSRIQKAIDML